MTSQAEERVIRLEVQFDSGVAADATALEPLLSEAVAILNVEWRRYRNERFTIGGVSKTEIPGEQDASWVLAQFALGTSEAAGTVHVKLSGRPLEVYTGGHVVPIGGLAFRGADALVISAARGISAELLAYYLFHEIGHCWDTFDLPFGGGNTTYGQRARITYQLDAGNAEILATSAGPRPRSTRGRAVMVLEARLRKAVAAASTAGQSALLQDLVLHEPTRSNPRYLEKRDALLASGTNTGGISKLLAELEARGTGPQRDGNVHDCIARHYWSANDAIRRRDYATAESEIDAVRTLAVGTPDVVMLFGAVDRVVKRGRLR